MDPILTDGGERRGRSEASTEGIERAGGRNYRLEGRLDEMFGSGAGARPYHSCQEPLYLRRCGCGSEVVGASCGRPRCPKCYRRYTSRRAGVWTPKLESFAYRFAARPRHFILSLGPATEEWKRYHRRFKWDTTPWMLQIRRRAKDLSTWAGSWAGMVIPHPARWDPDLEWWELSPHAHCIGWGHLMAADAFHEAKPSWIIKNRGYLETEDDIRGCLSYLLEHAWHNPDYRTVSQYGTLWQADFKMVDRIEVECRCNRCGQQYQQESINPDHPWTEESMAEMAVYETTFFR